MSRIAILPFLAFVCWAQIPADLFEKAPPEVEDALRARVNAFYQAHVDGRFRQAEALVAEDTKDFFYTANKPKYLSFQVKEIRYSDDYTKAKITMLCEMVVPIMGFANKPLHVPVPSTWKVENGQWFWHVDPETLRQSPFGRMNPGQGGSAPALDPSKAPDVQALMKGVSASKGSVELKTGAPSEDKVLVANGMPGVVTLRVLAPQVAGLSVSIDQPQLKNGEKAAVSFRFEPGKTPPPKSVTVSVQVEQTNQTIPVDVEFRP